MRLNEIIDNEDPSKNDILEACSSIEESCSEFVSEMKIASMFLYRGVQGSNQPIFTNITPWNRKPIGQTKPQQKTLDKILKLGGFKSLRSNSICCSSTESEIRKFGVPYLIFPRNGYAFTWSSKIADIGSDGNFAKLIWNMYEPSYKSATSIINSFGFKNNNMAAALESGNEITIHGEYMAISIYYRDIVSNYFKIEEGT